MLFFTLKSNSLLALQMKYVVITICNTFFNWFWVFFMIIPLIQDFSLNLHSIFATQMNQNNYQLITGPGGGR